MSYCCISVHRLRLLLSAGSYWTVALQYYLALQIETKYDNPHHTTTNTTTTNSNSNNDNTTTNNNNNTTIVSTIPAATQPNDLTTATTTNNQYLCVKIVAILLFVYDGSAGESLVSAEAVYRRLVAVLGRVMLSLGDEVSLDDGSNNNNNNNNKSSESSSNDSSSGSGNSSSSSSSSSNGRHRALHTLLGSHTPSSSSSSSSSLPPPPSSSSSSSCESLLILRTASAMVNFNTLLLSRLPTQHTLSHEEHLALGQGLVATTQGQGLVATTPGQGLVPSVQGTIFNNNPLFIEDMEQLSGRTHRYLSVTIAANVAVIVRIFFAIKILDITIAIHLLSTSYLVNTLYQYILSQSGWLMFC